MHSCIQASNIKIITISSHETSSSASYNSHLHSFLQQQTTNVNKDPVFMPLIKTHSEVHINMDLEEKNCGNSLVAEILYYLQKQSQI
jgi:hypothetical protein